MLTNMAAPVADKFAKNKHIKYFQRCLAILPSRYTYLDSSRMTVAFFAISGLDMLKSVDVLKSDKQKIIEWIYRLQVTPNRERTNLHLCGFRGSTTLSASETQGNDAATDQACMYDNGHIAMTYTALLSLLILGDDLSKVNRTAILCGLKRLQLPNGSFCPTPDRPENDMRFVYCACCVSHILNDWRALDQDLACDYILRSQTYEGGFGQGPGLEAHGGSTFCAVASLVLMNRLYDTLSPSRLKKLKRWCLFRQESGFNGRPNKPTDTCYSFWVGATLKMLDVFGMSDPLANHEYLMDTQDSMVGGFAKWPDNGPDALHSYFGICGLSLIGGAQYSTLLHDMNAALNVSTDVSNRLAQLHSHWSMEHSQPRPDFSRTNHVQALVKQVVAVEKNLSVQISALRESQTGCADQLDPVLKSLLILTQSLEGLTLLKSSDEIDLNLRNSLISVIQQLLVLLNDSGDDSSMLSRLKILTPSSSADAEQNSTEPLKSCKSNEFSGLCLSLLCLCLKSLVLLRDDLSLINRSSILNIVSSLIPSSSHKKDSDRNDGILFRRLDMRSVYSGVWIAYLLNDISIINPDHISQYLRTCYNGEGFFQTSATDDKEETTHLALVSLRLMRRLHTVLSEEQQKVTRMWCLNQLQSRLNSQQPITAHLLCLIQSLASLQVLGHFLDDTTLMRCREFVMSAQQTVLSEHYSGATLQTFESSSVSETVSQHSNNQLIIECIARYNLLMLLSLIEEPGTSRYNSALDLCDESLAHVRSLHCDWLQNS